MRCLADKNRSLELETPFFDAMARYFTLSPLLSRKNYQQGEGEKDNLIQDPFSPHGLQDDTHVFICRRRQHTLAEGWQIPPEEVDIMAVSGDVAGDGQETERGWGLAEMKLAAIEWDM